MWASRLKGEGMNTSENLNASGNEGPIIANELPSSPRPVIRSSLIGLYKMFSQRLGQPRDDIFSGKFYSAFPSE